MALVDRERDVLVVVHRGLTRGGFLGLCLRFLAGDLGLGGQVDVEVVLEALLLYDCVSVLEEGVRFSASLPVGGEIVDDEVGWEDEFAGRTSQKLGPECFPKDSPDQRENEKESVGVILPILHLIHQLRRHGAGSTLAGLRLLAERITPDDLGTDDLVALEKLSMCPGMELQGRSGQQRKFYIRCTLPWGVLLLNNLCGHIQPHLCVIQPVDAGLGVAVDILYEFRPHGLEGLFVYELSPVGLVVRLVVMKV